MKQTKGEREGGREKEREERDNARKERENNIEI